MDLMRASRFVPPPPQDKKGAAHSALNELLDAIELTEETVTQLAGVFAEVINNHRKKAKQKESSDYAVPLATHRAAREAGEEEEEDKQFKILEFVGKKVLWSVGSFIVRSVVSNVVRGAFMLARTGLMWVGRAILNFVIRPVLVGIVSAVAANPLAWLAIGAVGAAGYMVWNTFFSKSGSSARAKEADEMIPSAEQTNITPAGAAGIATPDQKAAARGSYATRAAEKTSYTPVKAVEVVSSKDWELGQTSKSYESGRGGPGTVSSGKGDAGGISYGTYQFASTRGVPQKYLAQSKYGPEFKGLEVNSKEFIAKWKEVAARDPKGFAEDQHDYVKKMYFDVQHNKLRKSGIDLTSRGPAVQDMVWSTAVQYGPETSKIIEALAGKDAAKLSDAEIVTAVQDFKEAKASIHFKSSSEAVQESIRKRAAAERAKLLALDASYQKNKAAGGTQVAADTAPKPSEALVSKPAPQQAAQAGAAVPKAGAAPSAVKEKQYVKTKDGRLMEVA